MHSQHALAAAPMGLGPTVMDHAAPEPPTHARMCWSSGQHTAPPTASRAMAGLASGRQAGGRRQHTTSSCSFTVPTQCERRSRLSVAKRGMQQLASSSCFLDMHWRTAPQPAHRTLCPQASSDSRLRYPLYVYSRYRWPSTTRLKAQQWPVCRRHCAALWHCGTRCTTLPTPDRGRLEAGPSTTACQLHTHHLSFNLASPISTWSAAVPPRQSQSALCTVVPAGKLRKSWHIREGSRHVGVAAPHALVGRQAARSGALLRCTCRRLRRAIVQKPPGRLQGAGP